MAWEDSGQATEYRGQKDGEEAAMTAPEVVVDVIVDNWFDGLYPCDARDSRCCTDTRRRYEGSQQECCSGGKERNGFGDDVRMDSRLTLGESEVWCRPARIAVQR